MPAKHLNFWDEFISAVAAELEARLSAAVGPAHANPHPPGARSDTVAVPDPRRVYTINDTAKLLSVSRNTIYKLVQHKSLTTIKLCGRRLVTRNSVVAAALEACDRNARCGCVICAVCSRAHRFRRIRQLLAIAKSNPGRHEIGHIYLGAFPAGTLATANVDRELGRLRKQLARNGFQGSHLIGGTEVNWDSANKICELHVHLLAIGVPPVAWKRLRRASAASGQSFP